MLSDNIKKYRKENGMSQDELAEKIGVSRQSISLWETDQTMPTIDNIVALSTVFNISTDMLLTDSPTGTDISKSFTPEGIAPILKNKTKKLSPTALIIIVSSIAVIIVAVFVSVLLHHQNSNRNPDKSSVTADNTVVAVSSEVSAKSSSKAAPPSSSSNTSTKKANNETPSIKKTSSKTASVEKASSKTVSTEKASSKAQTAENTSSKTPSTSNTVSNITSTTAAPAFDLFNYCKNFAIKIGTLNGDHCSYQQEATKYGGYENEYFSISYWADSNMVEFCLHCPLSDTQSENFYLRMRGGYNKTYEYVSSKYYRDTYVSFREATGTIDPAVFYDGYPINGNLKFKNL